MRAAGFLVMFAPLVLLVAGHQMGFEFLLPLGFFVALPALRLVFGSMGRGVEDWRPSEITALEWMPRLYLAALVGTMAWAVQVTAAGELQSVVEQLGFASACLVMAGLAACVAHDLGHRKSAWDRRAGHLIMAIAGYPFFMFEHLAHHAHARDTASAHCPRYEESVWAYVLRRSVVAPMQGVRFSRSTAVSWMDSPWPYVGVTGALWIAFALAGGVYGAFVYLLLVIGVPFLMNAITYIQHWGLGDDGPVAHLARKQLSWDEDSRLQSWLILGISFHEQHHLHPNRPYYTYGRTEGSPRLPADYALMVTAAFVPPLWRAIMKPVLTKWASRQGATGTQISGLTLEGRS